MKLKQLNNPAFTQVVQKILNSELPAKIAWKLKKIVDKLDVEHKQYQEMQQTLLQKYGKKDEKDKLVANESGQVQFDEDNLKLYIEEINELLDVDVDIDQLTLDDFENVKFTAIELTLLGDLIKE